jgi:hypothetical protein
MFPNLRLIIGAAIAIIALVMIMGSGVLSFRDPSRNIADVPDVRSPLVQHSIVANPEWQHIRMLAYARRIDELQRLLELPASPIQAYAPEPASAYPFKVTLPADDPSPSEAPAAAIVDIGPPDTQKPVGPPDVAPALAPILSDMPPSSDGLATPSPAASNETPGDTSAMSDETGAIPASSVPAIERPPLPPTNPREALARTESSGAAASPTSGRASSAKPRRMIHTARILPRRVRRAPLVNSTFGARHDPATPSDIDLFDQHPYNIH